MLNDKSVNVRIAFLLLVLIALLIPDLVSAQEQNNILDRFEGRFSSQASLWAPRLLAVAKGLFFGLVVIEWVITFGFIALNGGGLNDIAAATIRSILFIGFGLVLLENPNWIADITRGFVDSGSIAINGGSGGSTGVNASNMFDMGLETSKIIFAEMSLWEPYDAVAYALVGILVIALFAVMSAIMLVAIIEMYIVLSAGVVLLGFLATRFTKDIGLKYINYALSMGIKLFTIQLIAGLTAGVMRVYINEVANDGGFDIGSGLTLVAIAIVAVYLIQQIPNFAQSLMSGVSLGSLPNVGTATQAASGAVSGAVRVAAAVKTGGASEAARVGWSATKGGGGAKGAPSPSSKGSSSSGSAPSKAGSSSSSAGGGRMASIVGSAGTGSKAASTAPKPAAGSSSNSSSTSGGQSGAASTSSAAASAGSTSSSAGSAPKSGSGSGGSASVAGGSAQSASGGGGTVVSMDSAGSKAGAGGPSSSSSEGDSGSSSTSKSESSPAQVSSASNAANTNSAPSTGAGPASSADTSSSAGSKASDSQPNTQMKDQSSDDIARMKSQSQKDKVSKLQQKLNKRNTGSKK